MTEQAPIRMSVDDDGYDPDLGRRCRVFLDGVEMSHVLSYDTEAGTVTRLRTDAEGRCIVEGDQLAADTLTGAVEVTLAPEGDNAR